MGGTIYSLYDNKNIYLMNQTNKNDSGTEGEFINSTILERSNIHNLIFQLSIWILNFQKKSHMIYIIFNFNKTYVEWIVA